jgi:hypothetical protein
MDKKVFIVELKDIFSAINQKEKRYSRVWLSDENYGGLYYSGKYVLNAIAEHHIHEYSPEIRYLIDLLAEKLGNEKFSLIDRVAVYLDSEYVEMGRDDIMLYGDEVSYKAA